MMINEAPSTTLKGVYKKQIQWNLKNHQIFKADFTKFFFYGTQHQHDVKIPHLSLDTSLNVRGVETCPTVHRQHELLPSGSMITGQIIIVTFTSPTDGLLVQDYVPEYPQLVTPRPAITRRFSLPLVKEKKMVRLAPLKMDPTHSFDRFMAVP